MLPTGGGKNVNSSLKPGGKKIEKRPLHKTQGGKERPFFFSALWRGGGFRESCSHHLQSIEKKKKRVKRSRVHKEGKKER